MGSISLQPKKEAPKLTKYRKIRDAEQDVKSSLVMPKLKSASVFLRKCNPKLKWQAITIKFNTQLDSLQLQ